MTEQSLPRAIQTSIAPWLSIHNSAKAVDFYKAAFGATESYRMEVPGGVIARLNVEDAQFWASESDPQTEPLGGNSIRMILTVADPDSFFAQALAAGAKEIFAVGEAHGWRLGRLADPFGLHWEIGHPLNETT